MNRSRGMVSANHDLRIFRSSVMPEINVSTSFSSEGAEDQRRSTSSVKRPKETLRRRRRLKNNQDGPSLTVEVGDAYIRDIGDD